MAKEGRELAYMVKVDEILPLPGYDRVEAARIKGWQVIVRKDSFKPGDVGVFFEIDSVLPPREPFLFLDKRHFRIKTQKMCKSYSEGLLMPLEDFHLDDKTPTWVDDIENKIKKGIDVVGTPLTDAIGVKHYYTSEEKARMKPVNRVGRLRTNHPKLCKSAVGGWLLNREWGTNLLLKLFDKKTSNNLRFPTHFPYIHQTDETRIENCPWILQDKSPWIETLKIDGSSATYILERKSFGRKEFYICSRTVRKLTADQKGYHEDNIWWEAEQKYHIRDMLEDMIKKNPELDYVAIQGEIAGVSSSGAKIQGDPHKFGELRFFGYNLIDYHNGRWNSIDSMRYVKAYGIDWVPILNSAYILPDDMEEFKLHADGEMPEDCGKGLREGLVYRSDDGRRSFKNVSRKYLLKH